MPIERIDPAGLNAAPGLISQIAVPRDADLVFVSGQVAWNDAGEMQGVGDYAKQVAQVARNIDVALAAVGATRADIVTETIYVVGWQPELLPTIIGGLRDGSPAPASTLLGVAALFHPDALIEVDIVVAAPRAA